MEGLIFYKYPIQDNYQQKGLPGYWGGLSADGENLLNATGTVAITLLGIFLFLRLLGAFFWSNLSKR